jgi:hypothetical protein
MNGDFLSTAFNLLLERFDQLIAVLERIADALEERAQAEQEVPD